MSCWLLVIDKNHPTTILVQRHDENDLPELGVTPAIGEIYRHQADWPDPEDNPYYQIVGRLPKESEKMLDSLMSLADAIDPSGGASQVLQYERLDALVASVVAATRLVDSTR